MELQVQYMKTSALKPYENNAKLHPDEQVEQIKNSIESFGMVDPIGIWSDENIIVEGHGRLMACQELGIDEVPVIRLDHLSDEERKAYALAHNNLTMTSGFVELLELELADIQSIDMADFGFNVADVPEAEPVEDDYEVELPEEPKTVKGQVYKLGNHRLMCGDSTKPEDVAKLMAGADMLLTDPPYNVDYGNKSRHLVNAGLYKNKDTIKIATRKIANDNMDNESFYAFLVDAFINARENMKQGAAYYVFHSDVHGLIFRAAMNDIGEMELRQNLVWVKNALIIGRQDYQWIHEPCLYGWKEGAAHYFVDSRKETTVIEDAKPDFEHMKKEELKTLLEEIYSESNATSIIRENKPQKNDLHPTMKPIKLCARLILNSTKKEWNVLDLFGGSGSTLMACEQTGRHAYLMEFDEKYVDTIIDRWESFTGEKAELITE